MHDAFHRIELRNGVADSELVCLMRDKYDRHFSVLGSRALDKFNNGDVVFAEYRRDLGKEPGFVLDSESQIISALEITTKVLFIIEKSKKKVIC